MTADTFTCSQCGETFEIVRSDEEARAESKARFGLEVAAETHALVCDDCHAQLLAWLDTLSAEQRAELMAGGEEGPE